MKKRKMLCALVGNGYWGGVISKYFDKSEFELVDIYSRSSNVSFNDFCNNTKAEVLFVCTPEWTHYEYVKTALNNNKHVFCEKALCADLSKAEELYELAEKKNRILFVDYIYIYSQSVRTLKEKIGTLGQVMYVNMKWEQFGKFYDEQSALSIVGVHLLSVIGFLFEDDVTQYTMAGRNGYKISRNVNDIDNLIIKYKDMTIEVNCSLCAEKGRKITLAGRNGIAIFNPLNDVTLKIIRYDEGYTNESLEEYSYDEKNNIMRVLDDFYKTLINSENKINKKISIFVEGMLEKYSNEKKKVHV